MMENPESYALVLRRDPITGRWRWRVKIVSENGAFKSTGLESAKRLAWDQAIEAISEGAVVLQENGIIDRETDGD